MVAVSCPICEALLDIGAPALGQAVVCPECGEEWRVAATNPLTLVYAWEMDDDAVLGDEDDHPRGGPA